MIGGICGGESLERAIDAAVGELRTYSGHEECLAAIERAVHLAPASTPSAEKVELLGGGWVAEEALASAQYSALAAAVLSLVSQNSDTHPCALCTRALDFARGGS